MTSIENTVKQTVCFLHNFFFLQQLSEFRLLSKISNDGDEENQIVQQKEASKPSSIPCGKILIAVVTIVIASIFVCLLNPMSPSMYSGDRSFLAEEEVKQMYQNLATNKDHAAMRRFKTWLWTMKKHKKPMTEPTAVWEVAKNYLEPLTRMSLSQAVGDMNDSKMKEGTKWKFESIKRIQAYGKVWPFGAHPLRKEFFEGKTFEVYANYMHKKGRSIVLKCTFDFFYVIRIDNPRLSGMEVQFLDFFNKSEESRCVMDIDVDNTVVVQIFANPGNIANIQTSKSIQRDYKNVNLEFIREIKGVSIKASNGNYLEWKDEAGNHDITATAHSNESPNTRWIISIERERKSGEEVFRILNEAKSLSDDNAFIRFGGYFPGQRPVDLNGKGSESCWMITREVGNDHRRQFLQLKADRVNVLSIDPVTSQVIGTDQLQRDETLFELFIGSNKFIGCSTVPKVIEQCKGPEVVDQCRGPEESLSEIIGGCNGPEESLSEIIGGIDHSQCTEGTSWQFRIIKTHNEKAFPEEYYEDKTFEVSLNRLAGPQKDKRMITFTNTSNRNHKIDIIIDSEGVQRSMKFRRPSILVDINIDVDWENTIMWKIQ